MRRALIVSVVLLIAGCGSLKDEERDPVLQFMPHYASLLNGAPPNADSVSAMYAPTGELLPNGRDAIQGRAAIRAFLASFGNVRVDSAAMPVSDITLLGDHAVIWGTYYQRAILPNGDTVRPRGRYVVEITHASGGQWKIQRAMTQP